MKQRPLEAAALSAACVLVALFILAPFAWMLVCSVAGEAELTRRPPVFAPRPTLANYAFIFTGQMPQDKTRHGIFVWQTSHEVRMLMPALRNSFIVALSVMAANVVFGALAAYSFARVAFRGRPYAYAFILRAGCSPRWRWRFRSMRSCSGWTCSIPTAHSSSSTSRSPSRSPSTSCPCTSGICLRKSRRLRCSTASRASPRSCASSCRAPHPASWPRQRSPS